MTARALRVACPTCAALPHVPCRARDRHVVAPHPARVLAGDRAVLEARRWCARRRAPGIGPGLLCTLAVYASGPRGARERLYRQPRAILRRAAALRAAMATGGAA